MHDLELFVTEVNGQAHLLKNVEPILMEVLLIFINQSVVLISLVGVVTLILVCNEILQAAFHII